MYDERGKDSPEEEATEDMDEKPQMCDLSFKVVIIRMVKELGKSYLIM